MTKTAKRILIHVCAALLIACLALQFGLPTISGVKDSLSENSSATSASAATYDGDVKVSYNEIEGTASPEGSSYAMSAANGNTVSTPKDDDIVTVIVKVDGVSMLDFASNNGLTVEEALESRGGENNYQKLLANIQTAENSVRNYVIDYGYRYTAALCGFSATVRFGDIKNIQSKSLVSAVMLSNTYEAPKTVTENYVNVYEDTGIFNSSEIGYNGTGTVVGVVDTGTDYFHEVFDMELDESTVAFNKDHIAAVAPYLTATANSAESGDYINEDNLYINNKLPFGYDYADNDADVYPSQSHGTHVAGIIAGQSDTITGVAPKAQIATFKVFSDYESGAPTEGILAALNDAVLLGVDVINMSLGSSCGFAREEDDDFLNSIYDSINDAGICLIVAASNDYSSAQGSTWGNTNLSTNPDSGTLGSPASYAASLAVASVSGVKTKYFMVDKKEYYFAESRLVGKTESNDFVKEMLEGKENGEFDYVVIPGIGLSVNYTGIDVTGKVAVVKRGTTSFEEKVRVAQSKGAKGVIVYNNISGSVNMSIGTKPLIPSCFINMDLGNELIKKSTGKIKLSTSYLAGPFMSDFSSWGVLPNLELCPDITAHGGEIKSAVPGGNTYEKMSGTSMAAPNMAGAISLVRQFVKETYPDLTAPEVRDMAYSLMMSTATIVNNEDGNPYSPRKQGAGIADMAHSVNTQAYLTVKDDKGNNLRPKLSLGDDPKRTGEYELKFNIVNTSGSPLDYKINPIVMTESMSSDEKTVAEKAYLFKDTKNTYSIKKSKGDAKISGSTLSLGGYGEAEITVKIKLTNADKNYLNENFKNGMYVEGYVELQSKNKDKINLNIPYLAFYGDWEDAPMLDVTEYEVGESAADPSVEAEDKLRPDVFATLPMAGFASEGSSDGLGYWGLGAYGYNVPDGYSTPITREQYASLTTDKDGNYLLHMINAGLLRGAKKVEMEIRDSVTGELIWSGTDWNARKSYASGEQIGGFVDVKFDVSEFNLPNNGKYTFSMTCYLDWKDENGEYTRGKNNTFSFEFSIDNEAPKLTDTKVREIKNGSSSSYYLDFTAYDNHYLQAFHAVAVDKTSVTADGKLITDEYGDPLKSYPLSSAGNYMIPVYDGEYNDNTTLTLNVTPYWNTIMENGGYVYVEFTDYAKNLSGALVKIEKETDLKVSPVRDADKVDYSIPVNGQIDLKDYIKVTANVGTDGTDIYLEDYWYEELDWTSTDANGEYIAIKDGLVTGIKTTDGQVISVTVAPKNGGSSVTFKVKVTGEVAKINITGVKLSSTVLYLERGESAEITAEIEPYNFKGKYELQWTSTSANVTVTVDKNDQTKATVYASKSGSANIRVNVSEIVDGEAQPSLISGYCRVAVKEEFTVDGVYLKKYTGRGDENGVVEIPDDLGISYIYQAAFFSNPYIKKIIIPEGVIEVMYAGIYGNDNLEEVVLPESLETVDRLAFGWNDNLKKVNLENVKTIGMASFIGSAIEEVKLGKCTFIGAAAFAYDTALKSIDLTGVGTVADQAFAGTGITELVVPAGTSLGYGAFAGCTKLKKIDIYADSIADFAFGPFTYTDDKTGQRQTDFCDSLTTVIINNDVNKIGMFAFYAAPIETLEIKGSVYEIDEYAFGFCENLSELTIPAGLTVLGYQAFIGCPVVTLNISADARLTALDMGAFFGMNDGSYYTLKEFKVEEGNKYLSSKDGVLYDKEMKKLVAYPQAKSANTFTVPNSVTTIGAAAFYGITARITVNLKNVEYIEYSAFRDSKILATGYGNVKYIGDYAFAYSPITALPISENTYYIGEFAFAGCNALTQTTLEIGKAVEFIGAGAFGEYETTDSQGRTVVISATPLKSVSFENSTLETVGAGAFFGCSSLTTVKLGKLTEISDLMFANCTALTSVVIPDTVTKLGAGAFGGCTKISSVTLSNKLTKIPEMAFYYTALRTVELPDSVTVIGDEAFSGTQISTLSFNNVTTIGKSAFEGARLTEINFNSVKSVGEAAFKNNLRLTTVNLPNAEIIGASAFENCNKIDSVTLNNAEYIGSNAFKGCTALYEIRLANAKEIGREAFSGDKALYSVSIGKVESIGAKAFEGTQITSISLPASLRHVEEQAFAGAKNLNEIKVNSSNTAYYAEDGVLYLKNDGGYFTLVCYPEGKTDKEYSVINKTVKIGAYAFYNNAYIEKVTLPVNTQVIGAAAFAGTAKLTSIVLNAAAAPRLESYLNAKGENVYENFHEGVTITKPYNESGYNNYTWTHYSNAKLVTSDKLHISITTFELIERIKAIPANVTEADREEIELLARLYNILNATQKAFVQGNYNFTLNGASIDKDYYNKLLGGVNYYNKIAEAQNKLNGKSASSNAASTNVEVAGEGANSGLNYLWIIPAVLATLGAISALCVIVLKRRDY